MSYRSERQINNQYKCIKAIQYYSSRKFTGKSPGKNQCMYTLQVDYFLSLSEQDYVNQKKILNDEKGEAQAKHEPIKH